MSEIDEILLDDMERALSACRVCALGEANE